MKKTEQASRVRVISEYLQGVGIEISNVQCYEVLARALGLKNKHVLAKLAKTPDKTVGAVPAEIVIDGETVKVLPLGAKPYTVKQMQAMEWEFDVVIPLPLEKLVEGDYDRQNEIASEILTGNDYALEDLGFQHVPEICYGEGYVAYRVTAYISEPENVFEEIQAEVDERFYADLKELSQSLREELPVEVSFGALRSHDNSPKTGVIRHLNKDMVALLGHYAVTKGAMNDEINHQIILQGSSPVMEIHCNESSSNPEILKVMLRDLKYSNKWDDKGWHIVLEGFSITLKLIC